MENEVTNTAPVNTTALAPVDMFKQLGEELVVTLVKDVKVNRIALEEKYPATSIPEDLSISANYELTKEAIRRIKEPRIALEKNRKEIKATPLSLCKQIDDAARPERIALENLERPWKEAKKTFDDAEEIKKREAIRIENERVDMILQRIAHLKALPGATVGATSAKIMEFLEGLKPIEDIESWADEHAAEAKEAFETCVHTLNIAYDNALKLETMEEEQKKEEEERVAKEEAERKARDEEQRRIAKEQADKEAALQKERDKLAAEKQAIIDAQNRIKRKEQEAKAREEAEERERKLKAEEEVKARLKKEADRAAKEALERAEAKKAEALKKEEARKAAEARRNMEKNIAETVEQMSSFDGKPGMIVSAIIKGEFKHLEWVD